MSLQTFLSMWYIGTKKYTFGQELEKHMFYELICIIQVFNCKLTSLKWTPRYSSQTQQLSRKRQYLFTCPPPPFFCGCHVRKRIPGFLPLPSAQAQHRLSTGRANISVQLWVRKTVYSCVIIYLPVIVLFICIIGLLIVFILYPYLFIF